MASENKLNTPTYIRSQRVQQIFLRLYINGRTHIANFQEQTCTCRVFQDIRIPCGHAIAALWKAKRSLGEFIHEIYHITTHRSYTAYYIIPLIMMTYQMTPDVGHVALKHHEAVLRKNVVYMESSHIYDLGSVVHVTKKATIGDLKHVLDMGHPSIECHQNLQHILSTILF